MESNGSKIPLFDFFSAFAKGMSLSYDAIFIRVFGAQYLSIEPVFDHDKKLKVIGKLKLL